MDAEKLFIELLESLLVLKTDLFTMHYSEGKLYEVVSVLYDFDVNVFSKSFQQLEIHVLKSTCWVYPSLPSFLVLGMKTIFDEEKVV